MPNDENVYRILTSRAPVVTGAEPGAIEWTDLQGRVMTLEDAPHTLAGLDDVNASGDAGLAVIKQPDGSFAMGNLSGSVAIVDPGWTPIVPEARRLSVRDGISATASGTPDVAYLQVQFGGSGVQARAARADHEHTIRGDVSLPWVASGSHSSGTRTLVSGTITGLAPDYTYIIKGVATGQLRGEGTGAGYSVPRITIAGEAVDARDRSRTVAGVQVPFILMHGGVRVTGVSSITVSATLAYSEGDPIYVGGGELMISLTSNR